MLPEIKQEHGFTTIDVVVNLEYGIGTLRGTHSIVKECNKFEREAYFVYESGDIVDCRNILDLIGHAEKAPKGSTVKIKVQGEDKPAKTAALRLYSALSSEDNYNIDFERFEEENPNT